MKYGLLTFLAVVLFLNSYGQNQPVGAIRCPPDFNSLPQDSGCYLPCGQEITRSELLALKRLCPNDCYIPLSTDSILSFNITVITKTEVFDDRRTINSITPLILNYAQKGDKVIFSKIVIEIDGIRQTIEGFSYIIS